MTLIPIDDICKRQSARFIDHLKDTGQDSPRLIADFKRCMTFTFEDIKRILEPYTEPSHEYRPR